MPEEVKAVRDDAIMATGRTDYPNQVNNVLCFPYIFRGALDCGATTDHRRRWRSPRCTRSPSWRRPSRARWWPRPTPAQRWLRARVPDPQAVRPAPDDEDRAGGGAGGGRQSGVAQRPIADLDAYREKLQSFVYASGTTMKPIFAAAKQRAEQARGLRRGRGGARAARGAGRGRRRAGAADADRPPGGHRRSASRSSACG